MSAQSQKPIDFATEGLRLALPVERNFAIRDDCANAANREWFKKFNPFKSFQMIPERFDGLHH
jgi:hypothetical protein